MQLELFHRQGDKKECKWFGRYTWRDTTDVFVKTPEDCDAKQNRSRVCGNARMSKRGKAFKYVAGRNDRSRKSFCYL